MPIDLAWTSLKNLDLIVSEYKDGSFTVDCCKIEINLATLLSHVIDILAKKMQTTIREANNELH